MSPIEKPALEFAQQPQVETTQPIASLIELERRQLTILDMQRLMEAAMFNANYLHLEHEGRHLDAKQ